MRRAGQDGDGNVNRPMGLGSRENSGGSEWLGARCRMKDKLAEVGRPEDAVPRLRQGKRQAEAIYVGEQSYHSHL